MDRLTDDQWLFVARVLGELSTLPVTEEESEPDGPL